MTLDEAIKHAEEVADEKKKEACNLYDAKNYEESRDCIWCSEEHRQIAEWLKELKQLREQDIKTGYWIERESGTEDKENGFEIVIVCLRCDFPATTFYSEDCESRTQIRTHFCPNCGARMVDTRYTGKRG